MVVDLTIEEKLNYENTQWIAMDDGDYDVLYRIVRRRGGAED